jgi:O-antigen/teichoic acid export membrane protein
MDDSTQKSGLQAEAGPHSMTLQETLSSEAAAATSFEVLSLGPTPVSDAADHKALRSTALKATFWTVMDYGAGQVLRVVNSLVLTRLLLPEAFGEMMLVTTLIVGMTMLSDVGLAPSVIQSKRGDEPAFLNTAWTLQVLRGAGLWVCSLLLAWPAARFYHDPRMLTVLPVLAFSSVISGFYGAGYMTLSRHMGMRRLFAIDFSTQVFTLLVTLAWAFWRPSVWALVAGNLAASTFRLILTHHPRVIPGIRNRFCWEPEALHEIVHFGKWIALGTAFFFFASQADRLVLGKLVSLTELGLYGIAFQISDVPRSIIAALSTKVGYPYVSKISSLPREDFRAQFLRYRKYVLLIGAALLSAMAVWGGLLITTFYSARYAGAAWMVFWLALGLWHTLLYQTTGPVLFALGQSKYNAAGNAAYAAAMLLGIPWAFLHFGLLGAVIAVALGDFPLYMIIQFGATRVRVRPLWQDLQLTGAFAALLFVQILLRRML